MNTRVSCCLGLLSLLCSLGDLHAATSLDTPTAAFLPQTGPFPAGKGKLLKPGPYAIEQVEELNYWPERDPTENYRLNMDVARPVGVRGPKPVVLCIHGGGFKAGSNKNLNGRHSRYIGWFASHGYVAVTMGYTLGQGGLQPSIDVRQAIRYLKVHKDYFQIDANRIVTWGWSAGGMLFRSFLGAPDGGKIAIGKGPEQEADGGPLLGKSSSTIRGAMFSSGFTVAKTIRSTKRSDMPKMIFAYAGEGEVGGVGPINRATDLFAAKGIELIQIGVAKGGHCPSVHNMVDYRGQDLVLHEAILLFLQEVNK